MTVLITIVGKTVTLDAARETGTAVQESKFKQSGVTLALGSPLITAAQSVNQLAKAASQTSDPRMQALAAAAAGLTLANNADDIGKAAQALANDNPAQAVSLSISVGSSQSGSRTTQSSNTARGSTAAAGRDLSIAATQGDLNAIGATIQADRNLALTATENVNLLAAKNTAEQHSTNSSSSGSIGISIGAQTGVTLAASKGRGNADGSDVTWTNTHVNAGQQAAITSGSDTTLKGAVVTAPRISADVGGNLAIESLQDTSTFDSKQRSASASITIGPSLTPTAGSIGGGKSTINSNYASVTEQSGIRAGDQGFDVRVGNNTDLKGGAITSTQAAIDSNRFITGGELTTSDIQNSASYSGKAVAVNLGAGMSLDGKLAPQGTSAGLGKESGSAGSVTQAAISGIAGNTKARTGDAETGIAKIFDADKVQKEIDAQVTITQAFSREAPKAVANYAQSQLQEAKRLEMQANTTADPQEKVALEARAAALRETWKEGGAGRVALHTVMGGLSGGLAGAAGAAASASSAELLDTLQGNTLKALTDAGVSPEIAKAAAGGIAAFTAAGMGAVVGGTGGAITAMTVDVNNRQLHSKERELIKNLAKDKAAEHCKGNVQCEQKASLYWSDALERVAESMMDDKEREKHSAYINALAQVSMDPASEGGRGRLESYIADLETARTMLEPYRGQQILVNGNPLTSHGAAQTYFSATVEQRADPYVNTVMGQMPRSVVPLMNIRDEDRIANFGARNGSAIPVYPIEEVLLGGAIGNRVTSTLGRWVNSLDETIMVGAKAGDALLDGASGLLKAPKSVEYTPPGSVVLQPKGTPLCGPATCNMVINDAKGNAVDLNQVVGQFQGIRSSGVNINEMNAVLAQNGVTGKTTTTLSVDQLNAALANSQPVIVGVPAGTGNHFIIVDSTKTVDNVLYYMTRDPYVGPRGVRSDILINAINANGNAIIVKK